MAFKEGFSITEGKGFAVTFANGYTVSVQFGPGNYSSNRDEYRDAPYDARNALMGANGSATAETACWGPDGAMITLENDSDSVQGYRTPAQVLSLMTLMAAIR